LSVMLPSSSSRSRRGFTLLEILIALALLGVLAGALYGTYFSLIKGRESANEGMEARRELRNTLDILRCELSSVFYRKNDKRLHFSVEDRDIFGKPASVLSFTAFALPDVVSDQVDLKYEILEREKKMVLSRQAKDLYAAGEGARYPQLESIDGFLVECQNGDTWVRTWDSAINNGLPKAVRITVTVTDGEKTADYRILATPRMTQ